MSDNKENSGLGVFDHCYKHAKALIENWLCNYWKHNQHVQSMPIKNWIELKGTTDSNNNTDWLYAGIKQQVTASLMAG